VPARTGKGVFGLTDSQDVAWASARLSDQPVATYTRPLRSDAAAARLPRHFIGFTDPAVIPDRVVDRARRDPTWRYSEVAAPHAGALSHPDDVAAAVLASSRSELPVGPLPARRGDAPPGLGERH